MTIDLKFFITFMIVDLVLVAIFICLKEIFSIGGPGFDASKMGTCGHCEGVHVDMMPSLMQQMQDNYVHGCGPDMPPHAGYHCGSGYNNTVSTHGHGVFEASGSVGADCGGDGDAGGDDMGGACVIIL